jgi:hypothetical protein
LIVPFLTAPPALWLLGRRANGGEGSMRDGAAATEPGTQGAAWRRGRGNGNGNGNVGSFNGNGNAGSNNGNRNRGSFNGNRNEGNDRGNDESGSFRGNGGEGNLCGDRISPDIASAPTVSAASR